MTDYDHERLWGLSFLFVLNVVPRMMTMMESRGVRRC